MRRFRFGLLMSLIAATGCASQQPKPTRVSATMQQPTETTTVALQIRCLSPLLLFGLLISWIAATGCANQPSKPAQVSEATQQPMVSTTAATASPPATAVPATSLTTTQPAVASATEPARQPSPGPSIASARPAFWLRKPAIVTIEANDFESLWRACDAAARHFGFVPDRLDYRGGVMTTLPLTSKQFWELWRNDVATLEDVANSSLATYRRTLRFDIEKTPAGGYVAAPRIVIERYSRSETPITASVYLRNAFRTQRNSRAWGSRETDRGVYLPRQYWYATGRDEAMEKNVASEMRKQLAQMQKKQSS